MSTSEFDKQLNDERSDLFSFSASKGTFPDDFSEEDLAFVRELNMFFSPEEEELPPYFVQTLLEAEDPRLSPVEHSFAQKTSARVFRRLKLRRRLFHSERSLLRIVGETLHDISLRRSLLGWTAVLLLVMLFTVAFTAPSFASGMALLLHGARGGVYQVHHYPNKVTKSTAPASQDGSDQSRQISLLAAQQQLHFSMYWPQSLLSNYGLTAINLYQVNGAWADGPIVELVYGLSSRTPAKGTGQIVIREFKPLEDVLQLVQDGAAHPIQLDQNGYARAIYVDGQWSPSGKLLPIWAYGGRSELIYQRDGVVFWMAGDQHDGIGEKALWKIAQSLKAAPFSHLMKSEFVNVLQAMNEVDGPFSTDVLVIFPDDGSDGPNYITLSAYQAQKPLPKLAGHGH